MDWYAHSIEQEKEQETLVEKNKVKGVIDEITSSIGNILEENFYFEFQTILRFVSNLGICLILKGLLIRC